MSVDPEAHSSAKHETDPVVGDLETGPDRQPADAAEIEVAWRRLHPLSPLLRGGLVLLVIAGVVIANMRDRLLDLFLAKEIVDAIGPSEGDLIDMLVEQRLIVWALLGLLVMIAVIIALSWVSWRFHTFRISDEAVESRSGVVFRQHRRAPLDRIQSVNLQRSLLARIFGLTQIEVQTGGQGGKVALQYLGHADAKSVREQILLKVAESRGATKHDGSAAPIAAPAVEAASQGVVTEPHDGTVEPHSGIPAQLEGRIREIADFDIDPAAREAGTLVKVPTGRLIASILLSTEMMILVIVVLIGLGSVLLGQWLSASISAVGIVPLGIIIVGVVIGQFNKGFNFTLSRAAEGVRVGAGLTATTTETIPLGRIHAVEARQPLGWRPFGWWKVRVTTAGHSVSQGGQNKLQNTVLPVGEMADVVRVFETLLHTDEAEREQRESALSHALIGDGAGYLKAGPRAGWVLLFGRRRAGLRIEDAESGEARLVVRRGAVTRSLIVMPVTRAQSIELARPLMHRMLGLASVQAHTVLGPVRVQMRGIGLNEARGLFDVLAGIMVRVQTAESHQRFERKSGPEGEQ